jgi:hypothetical protein
MGATQGADAPKPEESVMTEETNTTEAPDATDATVVAKKSIVPAKYAGKYKDGGSDALATFINEQCKTKEGFDYGLFFDLCINNGLDAAKVNHYKDQVLVEKRLGSQGRARMTLRNMLATIARKDGKLRGLDGKEHAIDLPKLALTGSAAKAAEAKQETAAAAE